MRNLKKILALVLAMVMAFSVMSVAGAFTDDEKFTADYSEAAEVLEGMKVFQGYPDGSFRPDQTITRAEVAALIYRIATGDVYDANIALYDYQGKFTDVAKGDWAAGYINYCANAEYIRGTSATTFDPEANVTGYQVLAMILRAVGYDKNKEFTGNDWEIQVARVANDLQITNQLPVSLRDAAPREIVAELLFRTLTNAKIVTYTPALGYQSAALLGFGTQTLGQKVFALTRGERTIIDKWGRPGYSWTYITGNGETVIEEPYMAQYKTAVTECQIAADVYQSAKKTYDLYTNGMKNKTSYEVQPLDTVQTIGGQGTLTEVYFDRIVTIDTFLAQVTDVKDATYDAAGHLKTPATITLCVYNDPYTAGTTNDPAKGQTVVLTNGTTNYTYVKGNMVLINAWTTNNPNLTTGDVEVRTVTTDAKLGANHAEYAKILGLAKTMEGAQTFLWYNAKQHTVEGVNYSDAKWFKLDQAGKDTSKYTWYFDQYDNLIGATAIATQYTYGIVESIQWQNPVMDKGYAQAVIRYMDGTTETKVVTAINGITLQYADNNAKGDFAQGKISTVWQYNNDECGNDLFRITTASAGTISLEHVFTDTDKNGHNYTGTGSSLTASIAEYNHLENATIKGNATTTALAAITGTKYTSVDTDGKLTGGASSVIYANSNTVFLLSDGTVVKGYENMASYTNVTVDWVNVDGDSYVDFVYVCGTPDIANYRGLFYLTNANVKAVLSGGSVAYYAIEGYADGVFGEIKLAGDAGFWWSNNTNVSIATLTEDKIESLLRDYVNEMFTVEYTGGYVTNMWGPKNFDNNNLALETTVNNQANPAYLTMALDHLAASDKVSITTKIGNVLKGENVDANGNTYEVYYNVFGMDTTVNGYAWAENEDLSGKNVYVIYDKSIKLDNTYVAKAVYVADPADKPANSGEGEPDPEPDANEVEAEAIAKLIESKEYVLYYTTGEKTDAEGNKSLVVTYYLNEDMRGNSWVITEDNTSGNCQPLSACIKADILAAGYDGEITVKSNSFQDDDESINSADGLVQTGTRTVGIGPLKDDNSGLEKVLAEATVSYKQICINPAPSTNP